MADNSYPKSQLVQQLSVLTLFSATPNASYAFESTATSQNFPESITALTISASVGLKTISFSQSLTALADLFFDVCPHLQSITLPPAVSILTINGEGNSYAGALTLSSIPATLTQINMHSSGYTVIPDLSATNLTIIDAANMTNLTHIGTFPATVEQIDLSNNNGWVANVASAVNPVPELGGLQNVFSLLLPNCGLIDDAVDAVLTALDANGQTDGTVDLSGNGTASVSGAINSLLAKNWVVTVNT